MSKAYTKEEVEYIKSLMSIPECTLDCLVKLYNCRFPNARRSYKALQIKTCRLRNNNAG